MKEKERENVHPIFGQLLAPFRPDERDEDDAA